ncbi:MAG: dihydropteroate synthase [Proteobacteria bacterium]|nr:dihydropteroate synthase [Pseudomonadota bacterium]
MGIVNVTPDSFSDGGRGPDAAIAHARRLIAEGADILDVGGESTRPGAEPVPEAEEIARVLPVIEAIAAEGGARLSIDTMKPAVARAAVAAGATMWNDVAALGFSPDSPALAAELGCEVVLMHMRGTPRTMIAEARYGDLLAEVEAELLARVEAALAAGVARERIWLDPGLGFAKTADQSLEQLRQLDRFVGLGFPVLLGASRKSFFKAVDPAAVTADDRLGASIAAALLGAQAGVAAVRVHDVRETVQALNVWAAATRRREG